MKRIVALLFAIVFLLCACKSTPETPELKTADMLDITNTELNYQGCVSRFEAVISAMKSKVTVLEEAHNNTVKANSGSEYFLEKEFILTTFEPFILSDFTLTHEFTSDFTAETAKTVFGHLSDGMEMLYDSDGKSDFVLQMVSESVVKEYSVEYNEKTDSFRYINSVEESGDEAVVEFLEFTRDKSGRYLIQSNTTRCIIEFDDDDKIVYFCCGQLNSEKFTVDESVFGNEKAVTENWVLERGKANYINIHTYENGVVNHEDCSSGPWKSIKINEYDYGSAFYAVK